MNRVHSGNRGTVASNAEDWQARRYRVIHGISCAIERSYRKAVDLLYDSARIDDDDVREAVRARGLEAAAQCAAYAELYRQLEGSLSLVGELHKRLGDDFPQAREQDGYELAEWKRGDRMPLE